MKQLSLFLILILMPTLVLAGINGKISGTVIDAETGDPLAGTNVLVEGTSFGASTDADGKFNILSVPVGTYSVKAAFIGYAEVTFQNIKVQSDLTTNVHFELSSSTVAGESIIIIAETPLVNLTATNAVRTMDTEAIANLATRNVEDIYALQAGVVVQNNEVFIRGGRSDETGYTLEGVGTNAVVGASKSSLDNAGLAPDNTINTIAEALEEVKVLSGGYSAEVGGAVSGIVQQTFKTGKSNFHASLQYETDGFFDGEVNDVEVNNDTGTRSYGYNDITATASGPLGSARYFLAFENRQKDDYAPMFFKGFDLGYMQDKFVDGDSALVKWGGGGISGRSDERNTINGTLQYDLNPLILRFSGAWTSRERILNSRPIYRIYNEGRLPARDDQNSLFNLKASYFISKNTIFDANVAVYKFNWQVYDPNFTENGDFDFNTVMSYGDSAKVAAAGPRKRDENGNLVLNEKGETTPLWEYKTPTTPPEDYSFSGFIFQRPGDIVTGFHRRDQSYIDFSSNLQTQMNNHDIRAGASLKTWEVRSYNFGAGAVSALNRLNNTDSTFQADLSLRNDDAARALRNNGVSGFGYDEFGDEVSSGIDDAKRPQFFSVYINDKIEVSDIIVNVGLRVDRFDLDTWHLADSANPGFIVGEKTVEPDSLSKSPANTVFQPRLGLAFPISDRTVFHLQFGRFAQSPDLGDAFSSRARMASIFGGQNFINDPIGFDLEPIITTQFEIGFNQQISNSASFDVTLFYKNTEGQLTIDRFDVAPGSDAGDYNVYVNGDFAVIKGLEFTFRTRRVNRILALLNYSLTDARGTNSFPNSRTGAIELETAPPTLITPLAFEQRHRGSINLDYRFSGTDRGPAGLFANSGVNLLVNFNSGHRFTLSDCGLGQRAVWEGTFCSEVDTRGRVPVEPIGNSTTPWVFTTDLKLDKGISFGNINASIYMYVSNLFNRRNVLNVYNSTGNAFDDGFLTNPDLSQKVVEGLGQDYVDLYEAINLENRQHWVLDQLTDLFGPPREINVGVKVDF
ncbi:MAG: TonB-dependent receptor [Candidatus Marinimicrobia bacterium]|nr:TonB-dependent receptor [Candidatus Neomarinimicrobiota bacterium]